MKPAPAKLRLRIADQMIAERRSNKLVAATHSLVAGLGQGTGRKDLARVPTPGLGWSRKTNMCPGRPKDPEHGYWPVTVVAVAMMGPGTVEVFVAPVDQTVPSNRYLLKYPSRPVEVRILGTLNSREMFADIGFAGRSQRTWVASLPYPFLRGEKIPRLGKRALGLCPALQLVQAELAH